MIFIHKSKFQQISILYKVQLVIFCCAYLNIIAFGQKNNTIRAEIEQYRTLYQTATNDADRLSNYTRMAQLYRFLDVDSAKYHLWQVLDAHRTLDANRPSRAFAYNIIANIYRLEPNVDSAKYYYEEAYSFFTKENEYELIQSIVPPYASLLTENGEEERGMEMFYDAIELANSKNDYHSLAFLYEYLGKVFLNVQQNEQRAIEIFQKGIAASQNLIEDKINYSRITASLSLNLSNIYLKNNEADSTITYAQKVIAQKEINRMPHLVVEAYNNMSKGYIMKKQFEEASSYNKQANQLNKSIQNANAQVDIQLTQQAIYLSIKDYNKCIEIGKNTLNSKAYQLQAKDKVTGFNQLCECYTRLGNTKAALDSKDSLLVYSRKVFEDKRDELILKLDRVYQVEQKEAEKKEAQIAYEYEIRVQRTLFIIATLGILATVLIVILMIQARNNRKLEKLNITLQETNEDLRMSNDKNQFFTNISHELKTPLTLIISPLQKLLDRKLLSKEDAFLAKTAHRNSLELFDLTYQILELSKFDVDKVKVNLSVFNFYELTYLTYANFESLAKGKNINFQFHFKCAESLTLETDEYKIKTILKNLISNAIKFTDKGESIDITIEEKETILQVIVADTGQGIHAQDLPYVFDRYFQSQILTKISTGGTGVGLALCREYAKILNGDIQVQSEYGVGTSFTVTLPKRVADVQVSSNLLDPKSSVVVESFVGTNAVKEKWSTILLVEDNAMMQSFIKYVLQKKYKVIIANNGQEGLEILAKNHKTIQLVLSDVLMPVMNGYEFLSALKANSTYAAIPIIMLTALSDTTRLNGLRIGIDDYLTKPFVHEELLIRVEHLINNYQEKQNYILNILALDKVTKKATNHIEKGDKNIYLDDDNIEIININSEDLRWLEETEVYIKNSLQHTEFNIDTFVSNTEMSQSQLYRKIQELTGLSPNDYINQIRFETARRMLESKKHGSVKSIAQAVGFRDIKYFSRKFKQLFGRDPSEYLK